MYGSYPIDTPTDKMSGEDDTSHSPVKQEESEPDEQGGRNASMVCEMRDEDHGTVFVDESAASPRPRRRIRPVCCQEDVTTGML